MGLRGGSGQFDPPPPPSVSRFSSIQAGKGLNQNIKLSTNQEKSEFLKFTKKEKPVP